MRLIRLPLRPTSLVFDHTNPARTSAAATKVGPIGICHAAPASGCYGHRDFIIFDDAQTANLRHLSVVKTCADAGTETALAFEALVGTSSGPVGAQNPQPRTNLKTRLVICDVIALGIGWLSGLLVPGFLMNESTALLAGNAKWAVVGVGVSLAAVRMQQLYLARICAVRTIEIQRLIRACALGGLGVFFLAQSLDQNVSFERMIIASCIAFGALVTSRSRYRAALRAARRDGRHVRTMVMVGNNPEAAELLQVIEEHPEAGFRVAGVLAATGMTSHVALPQLGSPADALEAVHRVGATGVIVVASSLPAAQLNPLVRRLLDAGIHVHVASGLRGIAHHRIRPTPLAHEPLLYLESSDLSRWQLVTKRLLDVALASIALIIALPLLGAAALAVWLEDRGPILFRQERVGLNGRRFDVVKLRSMVVDAEQQLDGIADLNERERGPLFKSQRDPRVTKVGRFLRASSIDELPQLLQVLQGTMSLVGPRPALPAEVEMFDAELAARTQVRPGITGLWQVEARDNPAFGPYRRLDLFYIENWSIGFDLSILVGTVAAVVARASAILRPRAVDVVKMRPGV